jgi:hypothetical protein
MLMIVLTGILGKYSTLFVSDLQFLYSFQTPSFELGLTVLGGSAMDATVSFNILFIGIVLS